LPGAAFGQNTVTVDNPGDQSSTVGTAVSLQMHATDSASGETLTWTATGLPPGLSINSSNGLISGTPTTAGTSAVTVTARDTTGAPGSTAFDWTVSPLGANTVTVTNPGDQSSTVGTAVSLQMHATDSASGETLTWSATGLPPGLSINSSSGLISGTPTTRGTFSVTVTAKDTTGTPGSASFTWAVTTPQDMSITNSAAPNPVVSGQLLTYTLGAVNTGGQDASDVTVSNGLPASAHFVSVSSTQGTCAGPATPKGGTVTCSLGSLGAGDTATITIVVRTTQPGTLEDTATVSATGVASDSDDSATATTRVAGD
jgi:uncharacterized repeat protein (TIGR01451 family)